MKKEVLVFVGVLTVCFASCTTTGNRERAPVFEGNGVNLAEAIEQSPEKIARTCPQEAVLQS